MKRRALFRRLRRIERRFYPAGLQQLQDARSWGDLADYCEVPPQCVRLHTKQGWYALIAEHPASKEVELVDVAGEFQATLWPTLRELLSPYAGWVANADLRAATTYRLLLAATRRKGVRVLADHHWWWDGEEMHGVRFLVPPL